MLSFKHLIIWKFSGDLLADCKNLDVGGFDKLLSVLLCIIIHAFKYLLNFYENIFNYKNLKI